MSATSPKPNVLIVVVTYNRADATCMMLESLYEVKTGVGFELIVIDNCSKETEIAAIRSTFEKVTARDPEKAKLILNRENRGYAAGNNVGIRQAFENPDRYSHICLLNNDTIVSDFWLDRMIAHGKTGLTGPVSNSVGNEQRVPAFYDTTGSNPNLKQSVYDYAERWFQSHQGNVVLTRMLGFFCVMGPTATFQKIGLLDEDFGIGTYEDDDYCLRARKLEIGLWIARDVFVHHWGSASFSRLGQKRLQQLMSSNRKIFESKHGQHWSDHSATPLDAFKHELVWLKEHPEKAGDPLIQKSVEEFEQTVRAHIHGGASLYTQFRTGTLATTLEKWIELNTLASKAQRQILNIACLILKLVSRPSSASGHFARFQQLRTQVKNET